MNEKQALKSFFDQNLNLLHSIGDNSFVNRMNNLSQFIYNKYPQYKNEINDVAKYLVVSYLDVVKVNLSYDLTSAMFGCTTVVGVDEDSKTHWVGRNMDWFFPDLIKNNTKIIDYSWGKSVSIYGLVGVVTGLSNNNFSLIVNALPSNYSNLAGEPVLYAVRKVLEEAKDFHDASEMIQKTPWMTSVLLTLVGRHKHEIEVFEIGEKVSKRNLDTYPVVVTNNKQSEQNQCYRYNRVMQMNPKNLNDMPKVLADNNVKQEITAQTIFIDFENNEIKFI